MSDEDFLRAAMPHLDMLYNLARRSTRDREEAEDLVQETYLRALKAWHRTRPAKMGPWLATICLNEARSRRRKSASRPVEILDPEPGLSVLSEDDTAAQVIARLDGETVQGAMRLLSSEQREAITLMDLCGFTAAQVAEMLAIPRSTVLARVHRGHKRLAHLLQGVMRSDP